MKNPSTFWRVEDFGEEGEILKKGGGVRPLCLVHHNAFFWTLFLRVFWIKDVSCCNCDNMVLYHWYRGHRWELEFLPAFTETEPRQTYVPDFVWTSPWVLLCTKHTNPPPPFASFLCQVNFETSISIKISFKGWLTKYFY